MRKLASVQEIEEIKEIPGADSICAYRVNGWWIVDSIGKYKIGDLAVYFEIDSVVPDRPEFEFLRPRKFRIKTIKLRKTVSQGLLIPISVALPNINPKDIKVGDDYTETLGVTHYDPESNLHSSNSAPSKGHGPIVKFLFRYKIFRKFWNKFIDDKVKGRWPEFIVKTDEERCQNLHWNRFVENKTDLNFTVTEKLDGQSFTAFVKKVPGKFGTKKLIFGVFSQSMVEDPR